MRHEGVHFGVQEPPVGQRKTAEELRPLADTRNRLFHIDFDLGTFNMGDLNNAQRGTDPRGVYAERSRSVPPTQPNHEWPACARGQHIIPHIPVAKQNEFHRKQGSLERNIVGNCTVKNHYQVYYGTDRKYFGGNSGTKSKSMYR